MSTPNSRFCSVSAFLLSAWLQVAANSCSSNGDANTTRSKQSYLTRENS